MSNKNKLDLPTSLSKNSSMRLDLWTWKEVEKYLVNCKGIILPIGSTEQHGPTGAIGTDAMTAEAVAREVGIRTGVLVTPTQPYGMAEHHLGFPGTMSLRSSTLQKLIHDLLISLVMHGFQRIFIINGHGGNIASIKAAFSEVYNTASSRHLPVAKSLRFKLANWFMSPEVFRQARALYGEREGQHATPSEIALTLHLEPSLLAKQSELPDPAPAGPIYTYKDFRQRYPDGRMGSDPFLAKAEDGEMFLDKAASALSNDLIDFLKET
ncbi:MULTISPECIES: creatininase family protein [Prochlorococcus]|uniref:Predicted amidase n=1 Tax=Prochlorococcus marinus (strain SARG / CCMP1375 / SS120) TaxID=167539 RepID=Q7VDV4_PROMA|nr:MULTISPECIES: creatininase family protein [Prochlorococcus]AAP99310.1 Predicted amidase [Prochlorococcus marinus subsp. marinus str. CCMP1375]KGG11418.1 Creatinine amidohydrolase [Prochlorococcus marinus str. LG]KGG18626.1 Creatinine amidohydrolase [Prochlorococcus marinus str. SS2]KGG22899.1 Creatinine amidohydrolase [Prochlorococcus marinus str. SS35]KGG32775.1 Creatinine amidohydrolase [Prochlorococcus marinus str. SS51]